MIWAFETYLELERRDGEKIPGSSEWQVVPTVFGVVSTVGAAAAATLEWSRLVVESRLARLPPSVDIPGPCAWIVPVAGLCSGDTRAPCRRRRREYLRPIDRAWRDAPSLLLLSLYMNDQKHGMMMMIQILEDCIWMHRQWELRSIPE